MTITDGKTDRECDKIECHVFRDGEMIGDLTKCLDADPAYAEYEFQPDIGNGWIDLGTARLAEAKRDLRRQLAA